MAKNGYFKFPKAPWLEPYHQMQFSVIPRTLVIFDRYMRSYNVLLIQVRVDMGVMAIKGYSTLSKIPRVKPYHQTLINDIPWTLIFLKSPPCILFSKRKLRKVIIPFSKLISSSSSSCRDGSTDIPDRLSPLLPIVHRPRQVFRTTSHILT